MDRETGNSANTSRTQARTLTAAIYGLVMILMSLAFAFLWRHVTRDARLLGRHLDSRRARQAPTSEHAIAGEYK